MPDTIRRVGRRPATTRGGPADGGDPPVPEAFLSAVAQVRAALVPELLRAGVTAEEVPPPRRIAPHAFAITAKLDEQASGRLVLLHDPAQPEGWGGDRRIVALITAAVEADLAQDPLLADITWTWLSETLADTGAEHAELGGTVTRVSSSSFGCLAVRPATDQVELRASWSPRGDLAAHVAAWLDALCRLAGQPDPVPGVVVLPRRG